MNTTPTLAGVPVEALPEIADHVLLRRIGQGAYGEVWLARNMTGAFRAVKVIHRQTFSDERPFQREFEGICRFEPVSRSHPGLVTILHVGQNPQAGYFYYVMELADDTRTGQIIDINSYVPRTLKEELANHPRLPLQKKLEIALSLASALEYLHAANLVHRDIKPANIIFVNGLAKFADVGLMVEVGGDMVGLGTKYFMPPEGPGAPTGDIFSLGKVFYELFMGLPAKDFPELPDEAEEFSATPALLKLNNIVLKACHADARQRFQTAGELRHSLLSATQMVHETGPGADSRRETPVPEQSTVDRGKPITPAKPRHPSQQQQRPSRLSRRTVLFAGVPTAIAGAFGLAKLSMPISEKKLEKWQVLYDVLDDKLACFMGYVGISSPKTKFLIYSRGTDKNWITPGFQPKWIEEIEERFKHLTGRIKTMTIRTTRGWTHGTFKNPETEKEIKELVTSILSLPGPSSNVKTAQQIVVMDTTAPRGVYDEESTRTGITNAEVLGQLLQKLPIGGTHPVQISIESAKRKWNGEERVLAYKPALVIIHRSAFFHPVNSLLGLGYPPF